MTDTRIDYRVRLREAAAGDIVALSRLISAVESRRGQLDDAMRDVYAAAG